MSVEADASQGGWVRGVLRVLPTGELLPRADWQVRQRAMQWVLWAHVPVLMVVALARGYTPDHAGLELLPIVGLTVAASQDRLSRGWRMVLATTALVTASSMLVHVTGGLIESHFHFFAVVAFVMLYEAWAPFAVCIAWVVVHHAVTGVLRPELIYNHDAALARPALWAVVHALYVLAAAAAGIASWRFGENERRRAELLLLSSADPTYGLDTDGRIRFANRALADLLDATPDALVGQRDHDLLHGVRMGRSCSLCTHRSDRVDETLREVVLAPRGGAEFPADVDQRAVERGNGTVGWVVTFRDVHQRILHERELERLALTDQLTGLANRALAADHLQMAVAELARDTGDVGVLFCDLDRFKSVNDGLGHAAGDAVLIEVSARIRSATRNVDTVARVGGDEFVIVCPGLADPGEATRVARRIIAAISEPIDLDGTDAYIGVSLGIRTTNDPQASCEELLSDADAAMYEAKMRGADMVVFAEDLRQDKVNRVVLGADLRRAIERSELVLHYQPTFSLAHGGLLGVEALVRWQHPRHGMIPPDQFIPFAEESGLIIPLGEWVIRTAAAQLASWNTMFPGHRLTMAVNLSGVQLRDPTIAETTARTLHEHGLSAEQWVFEITETVLMRERDAGLDTLTALRALGVGLAIDDFGTGYSSLASLRRFPINTLKIDRAFVSGLGLDGANEELVAAIIAMAHALGLDTVAEGIESQGELDTLQQLSCHVGQGFLLGRPALPATVEALLNGTTVPPGLAGPPAPSDHDSSSDPAWHSQHLGAPMEEVG